MRSVLQRLGKRDDERLVIVTADLLGTTHAANLGVYDALRNGAATNASIAMPGPWHRHAAAEYRGEHVGVLLTLNAEHEHLRWGPSTRAPSLVDGEGGFPRTIEDLWDHADLDELRRECQAQVERAVLAGFNVTHLATHRWALQGRPEFFDALLDLACDYRLPIRLANASREADAGFPFRQLAADEGVLFVDHVVEASGAGVDELGAQLASLPPGVTELVFAPAHDTLELRAADPDWQSRANDLATTTGSELPAMLADLNVTLVSWRELRSAQRE